MEGVEAMSMRLTRGCGNFDVVNLAWELCQLKTQHSGSKLQALTGTSVKLRPVGVARQIAPDLK